MWFINILYWLQAFSAPVILMGFVSLAIGNEKWITPLLTAGVLIGIILAEFIRRRVGLDTFFSRIYGPNEMDEKWEKKEDNEKNTV